MNVLSVHEPFATMIIQGHKPIENRTWPPPKSLMKPGERFAIHATIRAVDLEDMNFCSEVSGLAVSVIASSIQPGHILGTVEFRGVSTKHPSLWFVGPIAWLLAEPRELAHPIPYRGQQGLWKLPPDVVAAMT